MCFRGIEYDNCQLDQTAVLSSVESVLFCCLSGFAGVILLVQAIFHSFHPIGILTSFLCTLNLIFVSLIYIDLMEDLKIFMHYSLYLLQNKVSVILYVVYLKY